MGIEDVLKLKTGERSRIIGFIREYAYDSDPICIFVSGGLDSDVTARLCSEAVGAARIRLVFVVQDGMEGKFRKNAYRLSDDLSAPLDEVDMRGLNDSLIRAAEKGNPALFNSKSLLDPNRAKCSLRTALISCYQDKGYLIAGASNRTETELGFFLPFGDNMAHFRPIAHLYKTQVVQLAKELGCRAEVIDQPPSAGFWEGQEDLTDLAYWIINRAPIMGGGRRFSEEEDKLAESIVAQITQRSVDAALCSIAKGRSIRDTADISGLDVEYAGALMDIVNFAKKSKNRPLLRSLPTE